MAEASCASVVRSARAVVADVGERAASKSAGLLELSNRSERNAERDCRTLLTKKHGLVLPIPQSRLDTGGEGKGEDVPVLRFRDWCNFLVNGNHTIHTFLLGCRNLTTKEKQQFCNGFGICTGTKHRTTRYSRWQTTTCSTWELVCL